MDKLNIEDNRIHLVLYFFEGHHTKAVDFSMIRKLQKYANIIPVVSKADSFKHEELNAFKLDIISQAADRKI